MKPKTEIIIQIICLIVILALCMAVYIHGKSFSCDKCIIKFTQYQKSGMKLPDPIVKRIKVVDLYSNLSEGDCLIKWDRVEGYVIG